jgi:thiamine biosynthesis lipoprotein
MADRLTRCRPLLGTFVEVTADSSEAVEAAFEAVGLIHRLMSAHDADSDVSRVNRRAHLGLVEIDALTAAVIGRALHWSAGSNGAFDPVRAGEAALGHELLPLHPDQLAPRDSDWTCVELRGLEIQLSQPACLDLGGIAKGFAADRAVEAMKARGARFGLINAGGDIAGFGPHPWPVQVVDPRTRRAIANVAVFNGAVATSSLHPHGGSDHLFNRDAGLVSATVCAPKAMDADALTKIVLSGSPAAANCLRSASAEAFVVTGSGSITPVESRRQAA